MSLHDWTRVSAGTFHDFHSSWITHLKETLNRGVLPAGFYAQAEQVAMRITADEANVYRTMRRTLVIRHRSQRRIVAMIEIVSPGNKDGQQHLQQFVEKMVAALRQGIHLLVIDVHPPGAFDTQGIHGEIWSYVGGDFSIPAEDARMLAGYRADSPPETFLQPLAVGDELTEMPLFLNQDYYVPTPLETTYQTAYEGTPSYVQDILAGRAPPEPV